MKLLSAYALLITGLILFPPCVRAQCGYPVTVTTNGNYCIGSTLKVSSPHRLETIVWYLNDQPVATVKAQQSLSTNGITVAGGNGDGSNLNQVRPGSVAVDDAGNVYIGNPDGSDIRKWPPGGRTGISVAQVPDIGDVFIDQQGNLYASNVHGHSAYKIAAGTNTAVLIGTIPIAPNTAYALASGLTVDCAGNVYLGESQSGRIYRFAPGNPDPVLVAAPTLAHPYTGIISLDLDAAGNLFISSSEDSVLECTPGDINSLKTAVVFNDTKLNGATVGGGALWVDGLDTMYMLNNDFNGVSTGRVLKCAPGASPTEILGSTTSGSAPNQFNGAQNLTMDSKGNIYVCDLGNYRVQKFTRTSTIDSTFKPNAPGKIYAVVTDMRGYSATTDTLYLNDPNQTPSIQINASATSTPVCTTIYFDGSANQPGAGSRYQWEVNGVPVGGDSLFYTYNLFANGDQVYCILETPKGCTGRLFNDTSNIIILTIDPQGSATVAINTSDSAICQGTPAAFDAKVTNGATTPTFEWLLNGNTIDGDDSAAYHTDTLHNGDIITCIITSDDACGLAKSNSIRVAVSPPPTISPNQVFTVKYGESLTLDPSVTGNITSWLWTPGAGLSDSTISDPVATPALTTDYKLKVVSAGCGSDSGYFLVNVYTPLTIPNAFTPNGDGHNDIFYVLGGPPGSSVEDFTVCNRWGQAIFHTHNATPGDAAEGWNGSANGHPAPPGTYVYQVVMRFSDGTREVYKGTVILIR